MTMFIKSSEIDIIATFYELQTLVLFYIITLWKLRLVNSY